MLSSLCFLFSISSGSAFASVFYKREYEDVLPLTLSGIVLLLLGGTSWTFKYRVYAYSWRNHTFMDNCTFNRCS